MRQIKALSDIPGVFGVWGDPKTDQKHPKTDPKTDPKTPKVDSNIPKMDRNTQKRIETPLN